jgi:D-alanyl-lipoteichoic acid acyltransferase DltB (MBOAT superfamily)
MVFLHSAQTRQVNLLNTSFTRLIKEMINLAFSLLQLLNPYFIQRLPSSMSFCFNSRNNFFAFRK